MQCKAEYKLYDKNQELVVTFFCFMIRNHYGPHKHTLEWEDNEQKSLMGACQSDSSPRIAREG